MSKITGIDEAGRGAIIGPLVIAAVSLDKNVIKELKSLGVRDSKKLTPEKREELSKLIEDRATDIFVIKIKACKIDKYRSMGINLDKIEAMHIAQLIEFARGDKIYVDSLTSNPKKFKELIASYLTLKELKNNLIVRNYLDENNTVVAAASIIAKVERDKEIKKLEKKYKMEIGVGYPHDPKTIKFIEHFITQGLKLPDCIRRTWITTSLLKEKHLQKTLNNFI